MDARAGPTALYIHIAIHLDTTVVPYQVIILPAADAAGVLLHLRCWTCHLAT
jgi:hypothetical protein